MLFSSAGGAFFDEYLINQAEQLHYLFEMYHTDVENSKGYYDIIVNYIYRGQNGYLTFNSNDEKLEGSGLAALQNITAGIVIDDLREYDVDLYTSGIGAATLNNLIDIVEDHANQTSR